METRKLTVRLPEDDIEFAKNFAARQGITLTELIDRYFKQLRMTPSQNLHPDILRFSGIIPDTVDPRNDYLSAAEEKHR